MTNPAPEEIPATAANPRVDPCPICTREAFAVTERSIDLKAVLRQWETALQVRFRRSLHRSYAESAPGAITLHRCAVCGFGRFQPAVEGTQEFYDAIEASNYYVDGKWEFEQAIRDLRNVGARRVLDVGCGSGHFVRLLREAEPTMEIVGQDLSMKQLKLLHAEGFETMHGVSSSPQRANEGFERFDAICMFQTLEHVAEPLPFLETFTRMLKPGGTMLVSTPNAAGPIRHFPDAITEIPPHHVTQWTDAALRSALARLGLRVRLVRYEPLPDYLWDSYLPVQWTEGIWPALLLAPAAGEKKSHESDGGAGLALQRLRALGIRRLYGVPGHTVYVLARKERVDAPVS